MDQLGVVVEVPVPVPVPDVEAAVPATVDPQPVTPMAAANSKTVSATLIPK